MTSRDALAGDDPLQKRESCYSQGKRAKGDQPHADWQGDAEQGVPGWCVAQASASGEVVQSTQTKTEAHHWHCKHETL